MPQGAISKPFPAPSSWHGGSMRCRCLFWGEQECGLCPCPKNTFTPGLSSCPGFPSISRSIWNDTTVLRDRVTPVVTRAVLGVLAPPVSFSPVTFSTSHNIPSLTPSLTTSIVTFCQITIRNSLQKLLCAKQNKVMKLQENRFQLTLPWKMPLLLVVPRGLGLEGRTDSRLFATISKVWGLFTVSGSVETLPLLICTDLGHF